MATKICFVVPDNSCAYQKLSTNFSAIEPPTWALLLAESCRSRNIDVSIIDCLPLKLSPEETANLVADKNPDIVCYVVYGQNPNASSVNMHGVILYSEIVSKVNPNIFSLIIGPHVAALPFQTLKLHKHIDAVSINEGVYTLHDLCELNFSRSIDQELKNVRGIVYRSSEDNDVYCGKPGEIVPQSKMVRDLPGYAWDLLPFKEKPLDLYRSHLWHCNYDTSSSSPFAAIYTSFGCIFKCSFCMINTINKESFSETISSSQLNSMRFMPLEVLKKSFDYFAENGIHNVRICDEMFFLNTQHYESILGYIIAKGYNFNMWAYARVDTIKQSQLELFKTAGVNWLAIGIESGSEAVRNSSVKGSFSLNKIKNVINTTRNHGISVGSNFIIGLPSDTVETCHETANLATELATEFINVYPCIDLPGSSIHVENKIPEDANYLKYGFLSYETIPNGTSFMSPSDVLRVRDQLWNLIYSSPKVMGTIKSRFGSKALNTVEKLKKVPLKRKLLGD